jgi:2-methylcitrate dehydratase PrpD
VIDRKIDLSTFTDERAERDDVQQFMEKVRLVQNPDVLLRKEHIADGNMDASVRVHMLDGSEHNVELGAAMHLTGDAVVDKFQANASFVFGEDRLAEPVRLVQNLEELDDVSRLMDAVTIGS